MLHPCKMQQQLQQRQQQAFAYPDTKLSVRVHYCALCFATRAVVTVVDRAHKRYSDTDLNYMDHAQYRCPRAVDAHDHYAVCGKLYPYHQDFPEAPYHDDADTCPLCVPDSVDALILLTVLTAPAGSALANMYEELPIDSSCMWECESTTTYEDRVLLLAWFQYWASCTRVPDPAMSVFAAHAWYYEDTDGEPCTIVLGDHDQLCDEFVVGHHVCSIHDLKKLPLNSKITIQEFCMDFFQGRRPPPGRMAGMTPLRMAWLAANYRGILARIM